MLRELGLPYGMLALIVNWAAGRGDSARQIDRHHIARILEEGMVQVLGIIERRASRLAA